MKRFRLSLLGLLLFTVLSGCGAPSQSSTVATAPPETAPTAALPVATSAATAPTTAPVEPSSAPLAEDQELVIVGQDIAAGLDPVHELTSAYLRSVGAGEALMKVQADGTVAPELALSITQRTTTTWDIALRPNVTFWSGAPVDAAAVQASLERSRALDPQAAPFLDGLTFTVIDPLTLQVATATPNPLTPFNLSYYQLLIHNAAAYGKQANPFELTAMDLTGPYKVAEFTPKQAMVLVPNSGYWGTPPTLQRVRHEEVKDAQARVLAAQSGQADIVTGIPAEAAVTLQDDPLVSLMPVPAANTTTVYFNLQAPALSDVRVRQALNWGVDRQEVIDLAREGFSTPAASWLASNPAYPEAAQQGYPTFDLPKAQALLDAAGWTLGGESAMRSKDGVPLTIRLMSFGGEKAVSEVLQQQWTRLGVTVEVEHVDDYGLIQARRDAGDWDALIEAWSTFGDPQALLAGQFKAGGKANYGGFDDPEVAALFDQLATAVSDADRRSLILAINGRASEQAPIVALHPRPQITAVQPRVRGFEPHFRQFEHLVVPGLTVDN